jgi:hypothetical protein
MGGRESRRRRRRRHRPRCITSVPAAETTATPAHQQASGLPPGNYHPSPSLQLLACLFANRPRPGYRPFIHTRRRQTARGTPATARIPAWFHTKRYQTARRWTKELCPRGRPGLWRPVAVAQEPDDSSPRVENPGDSLPQKPADSSPQKPGKGKLLAHCAF